MDLARPLDYPSRTGAIEIVPAIHLTRPEHGRVQIWLQLPEGSRLSLETDPSGRPAFGYPPGTVADRIESWGEGEELRVIDVRGTTIDGDGRYWHHVYRPTRRDPGAALVGAQWPADVPELQALGAALLVDRLEQSGVKRGLDDIASKLDCDGCHAEHRPENRHPGEHGLVARGTDGAGFFTPSTLLHGEVPLEGYGAWDPNLADPYIAARCAEGEATRPPQAPQLHISCRDGSTPRGTFALETALAAHDAHAAAHCATWRALAPHLPDEVSVPAACEGTL